MSWEHGHQLSYMRKETSSYYFNEYYFTYDANGMRTKMVIDYTDWDGNTDVTSTDTYDYTYTGTQLTRMAYASDGNWKTMDFRYDADGTPLSVHFTHIAYEFDEDLWEYLGEETAYTCCEGTYYYITNLQGDVIALVDESGNLAATYTYDAWGKSINTGYLDCIASANPLRYRGYVYDNETGFYYLQSRYYDPVKGRFISPDAVDVLTATPMGLTDKNLFAYCDNNPVVRADSGGDFWHIVVGAAVGVATQYISDVASSLIAGKTFTEALKPTSTWADYGAAALSGALAATGVGLGASIAANAAIGGATYLVNCGIKGETVNELDFGLAVGIGAISGVIGGSGADGANLRGVTKSSKAILETAVSPKKIAMYSAKIASCTRTAVVSGLRTIAAGFTANGLNALRRGVTYSVA